MKHLKKFNESNNWSGTILAGTSEIAKYWNYSAKMPERYFNYIKSQVGPDQYCELNYNTISIRNTDGILRDKVKMKVGSNTYSNICIDEITIWLSFGTNNDNLYLSDDGYFNTTIYAEHIGGLSNMKSEYRFTSDTIEDLCDFLNKILEEGFIEYKNKL
jgi:hypothetical protein